ncbi:hypothetical protein KBD69_04275 [Candidatus Woesebacteria bacterium]|nr:hypothetical protein [Candidatus Woesebacteria bacterium]
MNYEHLVVGKFFVPTGYESKKLLVAEMDLEVAAYRSTKGRSNFFTLEPLCPFETCTRKIETGDSFRGYLVSAEQSVSTLVTHLRHFHPPLNTSTLTTLESEMAWNAAGKYYKLIVVGMNELLEHALAEK